MRYCGGASGVRESRQSGRQEFEKAARKEVAMSVANPHHETAIIIGLVSDTHGLVRDGLVEALAGVSQILHAGDVGGRSVLDALGTIAPVQAVYGNVDPLDGTLPQRLWIETGGVSIHVSHGHELGRPTPAKLLASYPGDVVVYGHTHEALVERSGNRLVVNPGAAGPRRFDLRPSIARLTVKDGRTDVELVWLKP
jgi:putative phosphoesterase